MNKKWHIACVSGECVETTIKQQLILECSSSYHILYQCRALVRQRTETFGSVWLDPVLGGSQSGWF
jgi:hypothetical protein